MCSVGAPALLTGCSQAKDAASSAASSAASKAGDQVKSRARAEAIKQVCGLTTGSGPLADGTVSGDDRALAASVASAAQTAGISARYTEPLATLGDSKAGKAATSDAISALKKACADQPSN